METVQIMAHQPRLDTIEMVESFIQEHSGEMSKTQVWKNLPRKMMYQTFCKVIEYLVSSLKVAIDADDKIVWIHNPELVKRYLLKAKDLEVPV